MELKLEGSNGELKICVDDNGANPVQISLYSEPRNRWHHVQFSDADVIALRNFIHSRYGIYGDKKELIIKD